jgi:hypothetical protein
MRPLIAMLVLLAVVPVAAAGSQEAWTTHRAPAAGFTVDAPGSWIDVTRLTPQALARAEKVPALRPYIELAKTSKLVKLIVLDAGAAAVTNHFATSLNVVQTPAAADLRLERDATVAQLKSVGVLSGPLHAGYTTLPAGKAVELRYHARYGAGTPEVALLQFLLVHAGKTTVLTYTTLPKLERAYQPVFVRSAGSFRFA